MNELIVRLRSGVSLAVPASLDAMTTYVLLEQEEWFEKEVGFLLRWLRPGMTAIDVGANLGVYGLPMARVVGPHGHVFAYEPGSAPRAMLERSRAINRVDNLHVIATAVSDAPREGRLALGPSSELNSLGGEGPGETVEITCLDVDDRTRGWDSVDFIKIDAEGEEERILLGGKSFFARHSPLVMFEVKAVAAVNETLRSLFPQYGYAVYRLLPGAPVLVPDAPEKPLDPFELNLFAAKPDRAAALAREGLLVESVPDWAPNAAARERAVILIGAQAYASAFAAMFAKADLDPDYHDGLAGYAAWRSRDVPLPERCAALEFACRVLLKVCEKAPTLARFSTLARATWDAGQRNVCRAALRGFAESVMRGTMDVSEPFWPANPRFDGIPPGDKRAGWLLVSALEQLERAAGFSSLFKDPEFDVEWLCAQPFGSIEMERRRVLRRAVVGERVEIPAKLCVASDDHLNAEIWRAGLVPGTWVGEAAKAG